ncbi:MAG TPA: trypsin-like peptidase domain-containing protein [Desulfobacteria bacterium]|nr:trypsin-like peptidase domain-containing protein [Desulfobacteria bacterium]
MGYFDDFSYRRRPRYFSYIAVALVCSIMGGLISLGLAQKFFPNRFGNQPIVFSPTVSPQTKGVPSTPSPFPVVNISKAVGPAIVGIANFQSGGFFGNGDMQEVGSGSGIVIDAAHGYIATNNHVIAGAKKLVVSLADGRNQDAKVIGQDSRTDLAVVKIADTKGLVAATIGDSNALQVGEPVVAIGNPGGQEFARSITVGVVSALNRFLSISGESSFNLIQTDAAINPGNSGGALVNYEGKVVGINSAKNQEQGFEGMGFAIPISDAWPVIQQLVEKGRASHAGLLLEINEQYNEEFAQAKGWPAGALVVDVTQNGPADKAGIKANDILTAVNGKPVSNYYELTHELFKFKAGDQITINLYRNGNTRSVKVQLAELPPSP